MGEFCRSNAFLQYNEMVELVTTALTICMLFMFDYRTVHSQDESDNTTPILLLAEKVSKDGDTANQLEMEIGDYLHLQYANML
ncbi:hypothetical protein F442_02746 [Phytophthora nicotianae P10297]|uniref:Uncharacterized protein n=1 Tax=Phytophthora nicotianae P10297 TaxID=1317064 RepID=W2ZXW0_PHYNI|nr:hypothetical protein F442_02746 [Phytophthora nicotianae P10297]